MKQVDDTPKPPPRPADSHKGTYGTVIVIGGCDTMIGAPALCARAAFRSGAGLVKIACPHTIVPHVLTIEPSATGIGLGQDPGEALAMIDRADPSLRAVLAVGPGMGRDEANAEFIRELVCGKRPVVLDADGLRLLATQLEVDPAAIDTHGPLVLTPHPGEFKRLAEALDIAANPTDPAQRVDAATTLAHQLNCTVLLKGQHTVIAQPGQFSINPTGNAALATAGSGDVLTGMIASLIAQGMDLFNATRLGAYVHGLAAENWSKQHGLRGLRAIELADWLPNAFGGVPNQSSAPFPR